MKIKKFQLARQAKFILTAIFIHFLFFGFLSNYYKKAIGYRLIFLYQLAFDPISILSLLLLFIILFIMVFSENFFEYGIRNSLWLIPLVIIESWIWFWFIYGFNFGFFALYFGTINGYLTILTLSIIHLLSAIVGSFAKMKYTNYLKRVRGEI